jgi:hypothetical protein
VLPEFFEALANGAARCGGRKLLVDVGDLKLEGSAAESAILEAQQTGVRFVSVVGRIAELLRNQDQRECRARCSLVRRIAFFLTESCESSPRPICIKLYRLLHGNA